MDKNNDKIFGINLAELKSKFKEWEETHAESLNLFEIIQFGHFEPIHTKFLYWLLRPRYHIQSYQNRYLIEFLKRNGIQVNENEKFHVYSEKSSNSLIQEDELKRRIDLLIEIESENITKTIAIENKVDDDLTESQTIQEIRQYLKPENEDVFIAVLNDSKIFQFHELNHNSNIITDAMNKGIKFKLFTYSNWLKLNDEFKEFNKSELDMVKHLNENINRLIKMKEISEFNDQFKQYLQTYSAITHFENNFQEQSDQFLKSLEKDLMKKSICKDGIIRKTRENLMLKFEIKEYGIEVWFKAFYLKDNITYIGISDTNKTNNSESTIVTIQNIEGFCPEDNEKGAFGVNTYWIEISINPYNLKETKQKIINKLGEIFNILE